ncbi:AMP-binding enzyme [Helicosporidium sp. ATCC 50920]|nr:AMP-binding enzyme [Helicosporidium sp. ATCC 50920]|eukprot:KDD76064.1 AMP-binding enzyme [Helicosporidium sp. ATCC 50920]
MAELSRGAGTSRVLSVEEEDEQDHNALILYTSGTTGPPKGVVHTHGSLKAQVNTLCRAWNWSQDDVILHALPLHHTHGLVNALLCPLTVGARVEDAAPFKAERVWDRLLRGVGAAETARIHGGEILPCGSGQDLEGARAPPSSPSLTPVTVFMGVPTMYSRLLAALPADLACRAPYADAARGLRLAVTGSATCPRPVLEAWERLAGAPLLERYGLTETGMVLGQPLSQRGRGGVGVPFDGMEVRVEGAGELLVRGKQLFKEYWKQPQATADSFDDRGFFKTGDTVTLRDGWFSIAGRTSVDIVKSGGFKISALDVENALLEHPHVRECAVFGVPDEILGESIVALLALQPAAAASTEVASLRGLQAWAQPRLARYQIPREVIYVDAVPRNAMGKVNKKALKAEYATRHKHCTT